jgi:hypothetical protein
VIEPGNWQGEILDGYTVSFGQAVQHGPPRRSVEFSYITMSAVLTSPEARFAWPVIMVFVPTPIKPEWSDAGRLLSSQRLLSLGLSLRVTREQFSDLLRMLEASRLKDLHFTLEDEANGSWPVHSWGIQVKR